MITESNFDELVCKEKNTALIVFTAEWCRPCLLQKQVIENLSGKFSSAAIIEIIDVDKEEALADRFAARTLPTSVLFANGEMVEILPGYQSEEFLQSYLDHLLNQQEKAESNPQA